MQSLTLPQVPFFVIGGGEKSGRTSIRAPLLQALQDNGFHGLYFHDVPTLLVETNLEPNTGIFKDETYLGSMISTLHGMQQNMLAAARESEHHDKIVLLAPHGFPCFESYMSPLMYEKLLAKHGVGTRVFARDHFYKAVLHLTTTALGAQEFYNGKYSIPEAIERDARRRISYLGHPHFRVFNNKTNFEGKIEAVIKEVLRLLGVPTAIEIEKKYTCAPIDFKNLPVEHAEVEIEQKYLVSLDDPDKTLRVRRRGQHGSFIHFLTEKKTISPGVKSELESRISADRYEFAGRFLLPGTRPLRKVRCCFLWEDQLFEFDRIFLEDGDLYLLELELDHKDQIPRLPPFLDVRDDVTGLKAYSNKRLSRRARIH